MRILKRKRSSRRLIRIMIDFRKIKFIRSAVSSDGFINSPLPQLVFAGRSNVGKSSLINRLTQNKTIAKVGSTPGKTRCVNYFLVDEKAYLVDLPGYGYAKVSFAEKEKWARLMEEYFASGLITMGVVIVDIRHKPTEADVQMADWFKNSVVPFVVAANKSDKLKAPQIEAGIELISQTLNVAKPFIVPVSAQSGAGRDALVTAIMNFVER